MTRRMKSFLVMAVAAAFLFTSAFVFAQEKAPEHPTAAPAAPAQAPAAAPEHPKATPEKAPPAAPEHPKAAPEHPKAAPETGKMGQPAPPASAEAVKEPPYSKPYPMGMLTITMKRVSAGVGMEWGTGTLTYKGKKYTFKVKGLQVGAVGISKVTAKGEVYNLFSLAEFPGQYAAVAAGAAIIKGKEAQDFRNPKNVHIVFKGTAKGLNFNIGPEGFNIAMEEAK